jgi:hypothetical protein
MERDRSSDGITRREVLQHAAVAGAAVAVTTSPAGAFAGRSRERANRGDVAVLGGGMAGLAAAHELVERGFRVSVFERKALGGKARSVPVPRTAAGGRRALPGEHGFRFFPGFYHHVPDSMRRTPFGRNRDGVWNNLVAASRPSPSLSAGSMPRVCGTGEGAGVGWTRTGSCARCRPSARAACGLRTFSDTIRSSKR